MFEQLQYQLQDMAGLFGLVFVVIMVAAFTKPTRRRSRPRRSPPPAVTNATFPEPKTSVASIASVPKDNDDFDTLTGCTISATRIMSAQQARVYDRMKPYADKHGLVLLAEVSLSAIFTVKHPGGRERSFAGFRRISQKRVDMLLAHPDFTPVCGVEYHGSGHFQGNARKRDEVKRTAFKRAGLPLVEIAYGEDLETLPDLLDQAMKWKPDEDQPIRKDDPPLRRVV